MKYKQTKNSGRSLIRKKKRRKETEKTHGVSFSPNSNPRRYLSLCVTSKVLGPCNYVRRTVTVQDIANFGLLK